MYRLTVTIYAEKSPGDSLTASYYLKSVTALTKMIQVIGADLNCSVDPPWIINTCFQMPHSVYKFNAPGVTIKAQHFHVYEFHEIPDSLKKVRLNQRKINPLLN